MCSARRLQQVPRRIAAIVIVGRKPRAAEWRSVEGDAAGRRTRDGSASHGAQSTRSVACLAVSLENSVEVVETVCTKRDVEMSCWSWWCRGADGLESGLFSKILKSRRRSAASQKEGAAEGSVGGGRSRASDVQRENTR